MKNRFTLPTIANIMENAVPYARLCATSRSKISYKYDVYGYYNVRQKNRIKKSTERVVIET